MKYASFIVHLKSGVTCLQGWFAEHQTKRIIQANFIYFEHIGPVDPITVKDYQASDPNQLLKNKI